jgi:hypothetical protein
MSDFWYALASRVSADAFGPLGYAPRAVARDRRALTGPRDEADAERTAHVVKQGAGARGQRQSLTQLPCMQ